MKIKNVVCLSQTSARMYIASLIVNFQKTYDEGLLHRNFRCSFSFINSHLLKSKARLIKKFSFVNHVRLIRLADSKIVDNRISVYLDFFYNIWEKLRKQKYSKLKGLFDMK
jgi:hypothetical protein